MTNVKYMMGKQMHPLFSEFRQVYRVEFSRWESAKGEYVHCVEPLYIVHLGIQAALQSAKDYLHTDPGGIAREYDYHIESITFVSAVIEPMGNGE